MSSDPADLEAVRAAPEGLRLLPAPAEPARLADELLRQPARAWRKSARAAVRGEAAAAAPLLCAKSLDLVHQDSRLAHRAAVAAVVCARAARGSLAPAAAADLRARALAHLANARRVRGALAKAERDWNRADRALEQGSGATALRAELQWMKASLRRDQRRYPAAAELLHKAAEGYEPLRYYPGLARVKLSLGELLRQEGQLAEAFRTVKAALSFAAQASDGFLFFMALRQHALILSDLGLKQRALVLSEKIEPFYFVFTGKIFQLRGLWLKGKLHSSQRQWRKAEQYLERVRKGFLDKDLIYDAALAALDLALVYAEQGQYLKVSRLSHQMYPVFQAQQIPRESAATLLLFHQATVRGEASAAAIAGFIAELEEKRRLGPSE